MTEKYLFLLIAIEVMSAIGIIAAVTMKDIRWPFIIGFNTLLPVVIIINAYSTGVEWRQYMIFAFVFIYLVRMNWVLIFWFKNTGASKLNGNGNGLLIKIALPVILTNTFGWLYSMPFLWTAERTGAFDTYDKVAILLYIIGTIFHFGSDYQKRIFKKNPLNKGKIIDTYFWNLSRHPNYFGDFLIYVSFAVSSASIFGFIAPTMNLIQYFADAIPKNEQMAQERYGNNWTDYKKRVRLFFPFIY